MTNSEPLVPEWSIQDRLRKARECGGFRSQHDLAEAMDTSEATITRYESGGTTHMKPIVLRQWALACGVSYDWLTTGGPTTQWDVPASDLHERAAA